MGRGRGDKRNTGIGIHRIVLKTDFADIEIKIVRLKQVLIAPRGRSPEFTKLVLNL